MQPQGVFMEAGARAMQVRQNALGGLKVKIQLLFYD
jgi:hypothetical protein